MSKPRPNPSGRLTCTDVRFVEVDFPRQLRPRLVIEFSEGLSLLLEDQSAVPLAAVPTPFAKAPVPEPATVVTRPVGEILRTR